MRWRLAYERRYLRDVLARMRDMLGTHVKPLPDVPIDAPLLRPGRQQLPFRLHAARGVCQLERRLRAVPFELRHVLWASCDRLHVLHERLGAFLAQWRVRGRVPEHRLLLVGRGRRRPLRSVPQLVRDVLVDGVLLVPHLPEHRHALCLRWRMPLELPDVDLRGRQQHVPRVRQLVRVVLGWHGDGLRLVLPGRRLRPFG